MVETRVRIRELLASSGRALFTEDPLPGSLPGPAAGASLGIAWGPLSPEAMSRSPSVPPPTVAASTLVAPKVHIPVAGLVPSVASRACCLETGDVASWRVSQAKLPETTADGLVAPVTSPVVFRSTRTLSVSAVGLAASVVVITPPSLLISALVVTELLGPHPQAPSVALGMLLIVEAGLSGEAAVASVGPAPWLPVPGASVLAVPGVCLPLAGGVVLLLPGVGATVSHSVPCTSTAGVVPGVHLLAAIDAVSLDAVLSSPAAAVAVGTVLGPPAERVRFILENSMLFRSPMPQR